MFSDPMKLSFSYSHHFNWFYCMKKLQIFFRKVTLTAILFFHIVVVLSLISVFSISFKCVMVILYKICLLSSEVSILIE